jgi:hypothetical protein
MSIRKIVLCPESERCIAIRSVIARAVLVFALCVGAAVTAEAAPNGGTSGRPTSTSRSATANLILLDVEGTDVS